MRLSAIVMFAIFSSFLISCSKATFSPEASEGETFDAKVYITEKVLNTVSPLIFGDNIEWTNNGMGLWLPEEGRFDEELVEELREVGITHLRYPGGTLSDYFDWYKAIGTDRQPITNPFNNGKKEYPHFGPDEFMMLCRKLGIPGTITFNAGTGKPEDAVEWVKYLRSKNFEITDYTVGNEIYLAGPKEPISKTAKQYVDFCIKCKEGIDELAPDVKFGVISLHDTKYLPIKQNHNWMEDVLKGVGDRIDFIDVHNGYAPITRGVLTDTKKRCSDDEFALCFMGAGEYVRNSISKVKDDIARYAPNGGGDIEVHMTEYGPLVFPIDKKNAVKDVAWNRSLAGALYQACLFNVILKEPKITSANHLPLCQDIFGALIGIRGTYPGRKHWRNIVYYVFRMYSGMKDREVLDTVVESPVYSTPAVGFIPAMKDILYIDAGAYRTKDGKKLSIFLINRDIKRSASVKIDTGYESFVVDSVTTLSADSYKSENTPEKPNNVVPTWKMGDDTKHSRLYTILLPRHSLTEVAIANAK
ncbi:MAG: alpha-L-arabinofuranosidase C-terminal domain-containing protein [Halobacteria archaeon]